MHVYIHIHNITHIHLHTHTYIHVHRSEMFKNYSDFSPVTLTPGYKYSQSGEQIN